MSEELRGTVERIKADTEKERQKERQQRRLEKLRQQPCFECGKKPEKLPGACKEFALVKCQVCGTYFCCSHIMLLDEQEGDEERRGICKKCWEKSPETAEVKDKWTSAHLRFRHGVAEDCFIATAVLTTTSSPILANSILQDLRRFRDTWLTKRVWGRIAVKLYYRIGPSVARRLKGHRPICQVFKSAFIKPMHSLVSGESRIPKLLCYRLGVTWGMIMMVVGLVASLFIKPTSRHRR